MANANTPFGFALVNSKDAAYSGLVKQCYVPATNANKLYIGDGVTLSTGANTTEVLGHAAGSLPVIAKASTSGKIDGVIVGFLPNGEFTGATTLAASTEGVALVILNPMAKFNIQANGTVTAAMVGKYANISTTTAGNDFSGISGMALDVSTVDTDNSLQLKILNIPDYITNEIGDYTVLTVALNGAAGLDLSEYLTSATAATTYVPQTRTINSKPLSADVVLTASDVGAEPAQG